MKIMHVICGPGAGGAEIFVKDMAVKMARDSHKIHIVFLQTAIESGRDKEFGEHFLSSLTEAGIGYDFIGVKARKNPLWGMVRMRRIVKEVGPDIVHSHLYWPLVFLAFIPGVRVVFTKHSIEFGAPIFLLRLVMLRVKAFVAICGACREEFKSLAGKKIVQIDNGTSFKNPVRVVNKNSGVVRVLYVGRLYEVKNIGMLLRSCKKIEESNFELHIAGEGPQLNELRLLAEEIGISHKVFFLGNINNVDEVMSRSDIFVLSSNSEGLPISLIEASISGLPCVVTNVGGCEEVIEKCRNGFSVEAGDVEGFSCNLKRLIDDSSLREEFSRNALNESKYYSIERVVADHIKLYKNVLL